MNDFTSNKFLLFYLFTILDLQKSAVIIKSG